MLNYDVAYDDMEAQKSKERIYSEIYIKGNCRLFLKYTLTNHIWYIVTLDILNELDDSILDTKLLYSGYHLKVAVEEFNNYISANISKINNNEDKSDV